MTDDDEDVGCAVLLSMLAGLALALTAFAVWIWPRT